MTDLTISQATLDSFCATVPRKPFTPVVMRYGPWGLTLAEVQVMDIACVNGTIKGIAKSRNTAISTVSDQLKAIYQKLDVHHMAVAVAMFVLWRHTDGGKAVVT